MNPNVYASSVQKDISLIEKEKVILVGINQGIDEKYYYEMKELESLCEASNYEVIENVTQNLAKPNPATYVGSGKVGEISELCEALDIKKIVINDELTPAQIKNLAEALGDEISIIDRTMLILEIFERRATSKEGQLQVELAKLKYMLPRLVGSRSYLSRTGGGGGGAGGARRGLGETKLELDKRHLEMKIKKVKDELEELKLNRQAARKLRSTNDIKTVALVGYTNAGKSSTINALLSLFGEADLPKEVFVKDMLFATLEAQTRKIKLPNNHTFLLTDTVGFVSKLPHHLVESFKSTLEEITEADLIIHIIDASSPFYEQQMATTLEVINSLGVKEIPIISVYNKWDLVRNASLINMEKNSLTLSAKLKMGLMDLINKIDEVLFNEIYLDEFLIPYDKGDISNILIEKADVVELQYQNEGTYIKAGVTKEYHQKYQQYIIKNKNA